MYLCVRGFLPDDFEDDSLKFRLAVDGILNERIVKILGHRSLNAMAEGEWALTSEQVADLSSTIGQPLPTDLDLFIGVVAQ